MNQSQDKIRILGTRGSAPAYAIRDFLHRSDVPFQWIELTTDEQVREHAQLDDLGDSRLPVCIFPDGTRLERPTVRQITEKLGWFRNPTQSEYDLAIYGGGPAGLSAAVYGASEGLKTVLIERSVIGGQAGSSSKIENYLGFPQGIREPISQSAPASKRPNSALKFCCCAKAFAASFSRGKASVIWPTARRSLRGPPFAPREWITGASACRTRTTFGARDFFMAPGRAKPPFARTSP